MHHTTTTRTTHPRRRMLMSVLLSAMLTITLGSAIIAGADASTRAAMQGPDPTSGIADCYLLTSADEIDVCFRAPDGTVSSASR